MSRKSIVSINRLRANHSSTKSSLFRKNIVSDFKCECDSVSEQSIEHIFFQCKLFDKERRNFISLISKTHGLFPISLINILQCKDTTLINAFSSFIEEIKLSI